MVFHRIDTHTNRALCLPVSYFHTLTHIVSQLLTIHTHKTNNSVVDRMTIFSEVMNNHRNALCASRARIPVASQVTALEIWLLACILLVFGALGEYAFILRQVIQLSRKLRRQRVGSAVASSHAILQVISFFKKNQIRPLSFYLSYQYIFHDDFEPYRNTLYYYVLNNTT